MNKILNNRTMFKQACEQMNEILNNRTMFKQACEKERRSHGLIVNYNQIINCLDCELTPEECSI